MIAMAGLTSQRRLRLDVFAGEREQARCLHQLGDHERHSRENARVHEQQGDYNAKSPDNLAGTTDQRQLAHFTARAFKIDCSVLFELKHSW